MLKKSCLIIVMLPALLYSSLLIVAVTPLATMMHVNPPTKTVGLGDILTINISIVDVINLYSWQFKIYYSNNVLRCTNVTEGTFLKSGADTFWHNRINNVYNNTHSWLAAGCSLLGMMPGVDGNGVLATVTFKALSTGSTALHLFDTGLWDPPGVGANPISHTTSDGTVHIELVAGHDVAVTEIVSSKTVVCQGNSASFNVTVQDQGIYAETFAIALYTNTTLINTQTVTLTSGNSKVLTFIWVTIDFPLGNCTMKAEATINEDIDPADNTLSRIIPVAIKGDINADGTVNIKDLYAVAKAFGSKPGQERWNPNADLNEDQQINIIDMYTIAREFGKTR